MTFKAIQTPLSGVLLIEPTVHGDERGHFFESYHRQDFLKLGIDLEFVQDNQSRSRRGTLRGLHFQRRHPQAKLVRVLRGRVYDAVVDLRRSSPTRGRAFGVELDDRDKRQIFIPAGFAHGFLALSAEADLSYKCSDFYHPEDEGGLIWNDPQIAIPWPVQGIERVLLSDKDQRNPRFADLEPL